MGEHTNAAAVADATVVLVHGAYRGAWSWSRLAPILVTMGYNVCVPELSGLGGRANEIRPEIGLETHIEDVNDLLAELGHDVILVGASYGGLVITGVAARARVKITGMIYIDAAVPEPGDSMWLMFDTERRHDIIELAIRQGDGWRLPAMTATVFGDLDETDANFISSNLCDQPLLTFLQILDFEESLFANIPRAFIRCVNTLPPKPSPVSRSAERVKHAAGWQYLSVDGNHDAMLTHPSPIADILHECIRSQSSHCGPPEGSQVS